MDLNPPISSTGTPSPLDQDMTEMVLHLPRAQALGLIEAAKQQGLSVAQLLRRLVSRAIAELATARTSLN